MGVSTTVALRNEVGANLKLALPIMVTQFTFMGMATADTMLAGRHSADALAAVAVGANIWFLLLIMFMGTLMACAPIIAQRVGAGRDADDTGVFVRGALLIAAALGVAWMLLMRIVPGPVLAWLQLGEPAQQYAYDYLMAASWSGVPLCLCFVARNAAEAHGLTQVALVCGVIGLITNVLVAYGLLFGHWGLPELGPEGCGWGSTAAALAMLLAYAAQFARLPALRALRIFRRGWPVWQTELREVLRLGLPIAMILAAESWLFNVCALLMARFGAGTVAAHQVAINFAGLCFMVPLSIGFATTVRVGYAAGAQDFSAVRLRGQTGMLMGMVFSLVSASVMAFFPAWVVGLYTDDVQVQRIAVQFLLFAALFQLFDGIQATANGALRGVKDTKMPMLITVTAYWLVGLPLAVGLAFTTTLAARGIWVGFVVALALAALGLGLRFRRVGQKFSRVPR